MQNLTPHLRSLTPHQKATTHPFLHAAGNGTLPKQTLSKWLSQDRLYAQSYITFIGSLLSKLQLPTSPSPSAHATIAKRVIRVLIDALQNITRELEFFKSVAGEYGLDLGMSWDCDLDDFGNGNDNEEKGKERFGPSPVTHAYLDMFGRAGSAGASLLEGMVVLWASEVCYLTAWRFARGVMESTEGRGELDGGALRERFIPNWTSGEFEEFVNAIGDLVDELAGEVDGREKEVLLEKCEGWWRQVVWLEERFWPEV
ncbi:heme oxygenase-like protein [Aspergillus avenaceus]|uniref:Heme oxygenase-like protein n=1 Tax=Aspergillus avenaceus TaxID=36643 RepID=A0A5N6TDB4_ASPAV|nr:heme oxygenase-like protein [Aspergillus avenaceus]